MRLSEMGRIVALVPGWVPVRHQITVRTLVKRPYPLSFFVLWLFCIFLLGFIVLFIGLRREVLDVEIFAVFPEDFLGIVEFVEFSGCIFACYSEQYLA